MSNRRKYEFELKRIEDEINMLIKQGRLSKDSSYIETAVDVMDKQLKNEVRRWYHINKQKIGHLEQPIELAYKVREALIAYISKKYLANRKEESRCTIDELLREIRHFLNKECENY
ncbi:MAG: hypothetical protein QXK64_03710 [Candidatus Woesearchaeota archaeon]